MRVVCAIAACLAVGLVCMKAEDVEEHQSAALSKLGNLRELSNETQNNFGKQSAAVSKLGNPREPSNETQNNFGKQSAAVSKLGNPREPSNETQNHFGEFFAKFLQDGPKASKVGNCTGSTQPNPAEFFEQLKSFYQKWSNSTKLGNGMMTANATRPGLLPGNGMMTVNATRHGFMPGNGTMTAPMFMNMFTKSQVFSWLNATWPNIAKITWSRFHWNRTVASGVTIREAAFIPNGSDVVVFRAEVMSLKKRNVISCTSVFDFTNSSAIVIYIPDNMLAPCLLSGTDLTFDGLKEELATQNGSHVTRDSKKSLYVNADPLTSEEVEALKQSNPSVRLACGFRPIHRVGPLEANDEPANRGTVLRTLLVALDSVFDIIFPIDIFLSRFDLALLETPALP